MSETVLAKSTMSNQKKVSIMAGIFFFVIVLVHVLVSRFADITYLIRQDAAKQLLEGGNANFIQKPLAQLVVDHPGMGFINNILISQSMLLIPVIIFLLIVCCAKWIKLSDVLHLKKIHFATWFLIPVLCLLLQPSLMCINALSQLVFTNKIGGVLTGTVTSLPYIAALLLISLTPALVEEMTCRGMVYGSLAHDKDPVPAIIISALTFGLMHMNFNQFLYASALGAIMACLVYCSGSIYTSSLLHFLFNGTSVTLLFIITKIIPVLFGHFGGNGGNAMSPEMYQETLNQAMSSGADPAQLILLGGMLLIPGIGGLALAVGVLYLIAKLNHREELVKALFRKRTPESKEAFLAARKSDRKEKGRYLNVFLGAAWIFAFVICILTEFNI